MIIQIKSSVFCLGSKSARDEHIPEIQLDASTNTHNLILGERSTIGTLNAEPDFSVIGKIYRVTMPFIVLTEIGIGHLEDHIILKPEKGQYNADRKSTRLNSSHSCASSMPSSA